MGTIWLKARWTQPTRSFSFLLVWWLRPTLRLNPRLRLTPLSSTAPMAITTPVFTLDFTTPTSTAPTTDPMVDITILARDLLRLNPRLRLRLNPRLGLRLTPLSSTAPMAMVTPVFTLDFTTPTPTAPIITDLTDMPTGDKRLSESSQKKI